MTAVVAGSAGLNHHSPSYELVSTLLALIPLLALPWLLGTALLTRAHPVGERWWLGALVVALLRLTCLGFATTQQAADLLVAALALLALALLWYRDRRLGPQWPGAIPPVVGLLAPLALGMGVGVLCHPIGLWDGVTIWLAKTKAVYYWTPLADLPFFWYPNLGPMLWAWPLRFSGMALEGVGRLVFLFGWLAWLLGLWQQAGRPRTGLAAALFALVAYATFDITTMVGGQQDGLVWVLIGMACNGWWALHGPLSGQRDLARLRTSRCKRAQPQTRKPIQRRLEMRSKRDATKEQQVAAGARLRPTQPTSQQA